MPLLESSIPSRTRTALAWNTAGVAVKTTLGFVRFVLLSRWLPVSAFGLMATSQAITGITLPIAVLGSAGAYLVLHKSANSAEERALQDSFFFLRISLLGLWVLICGLIALLFLPPTERWVLVSLAVIRAVADVSLIPKIIEVGKLETQKQSLSMVGESLVYLLIGLPIAWLWRNVWALLVGEFAVALFAFWFFFAWQKVWLPSRQASRYWVKNLLNTGSKIMFNVVLRRLLDQIDDLWVRWQLGVHAIGIYNRAYQLADMPATIFETIGSTVVFSSYTAYQQDFLRLRRHYLKMNAYALLVSVPIAVAGWFLLPSAVTLFLGTQWVESIPVLRWMAIFMALQPLRMTSENIFDATKTSKKLTVLRVTQLLLMLTSFFTMQFLGMGLIGIAISVDITIGIGVVICFFYALMQMKS
ncbi:MAG TPA: oligosaccharide flippase family protein [Anaerolineales bacterium]|nr:oligosaccharide flippase family protein [Anaerolineales bacterium]